MPRDITIHFSDGTAHQYNNAPDVLTPDDIEKRIKKDYPDKKIVRIDGGKKSSTQSTELDQVKKTPGLLNRDITDKLTGEVKAKIAAIDGDKGSSLAIKPGVGILIGLQKHIIAYNQLARGYPYTAQARIKIGDGPVENGQLWRDNSDHMGRLQFTSFFGGREKDIINKLTNFDGQVKLEVNCVNRFGPYTEVFTFNF